MKKIGTVIFWAVCILYVCFAILANVFSAFDFIADIATKLGSGSMIRGFILAPFAIYGMVLMARGAFSVWEKDSYHFKKEWKFGIYSLVMLLSYISLFELAKILPH